MSLCDHGRSVSSGFPATKNTSKQPSLESGYVPSPSELSSGVAAHLSSTTRNRFYSLRLLYNDAGKHVFGAEVLANTQYEQFSDASSASDGDGLPSLDLSSHSPFTDIEFIHQLKKDITSFRLLLFRKQNLSPELQVMLSSALGRVETRSADYNKELIKQIPPPGVTLISNDEIYGFVPKDSHLWHSDGAFTTQPPVYQVLHMKKQADGGAYTHFLALNEFLEAQRCEESKTCCWPHLWRVVALKKCWVHSANHHLGKMMVVAAKDDPQRCETNGLLPFVIRHPLRGDASFLVHSMLEAGTIALITKTSDLASTPTTRKRNEISESLGSLSFDAKLRATMDEAMSKYGLVMKWKEGDLVIADNIALAHKACAPFVSADPAKTRFSGLRLLQRCTIIGQPEEKIYPLSSYYCDGEAVFPEDEDQSRGKLMGAGESSYLCKNQNLGHIGDAGLKLRKRRRCTPHPVEAAATEASTVDGVKWMTRQTAV